MAAAYRVAEVAERHCVSPRSIYDAIERGDLRAERIGRSIRLRTDDVDRWLGHNGQPDRAGP
jgi:excisionase family DNA binding protein